MAVVGAVVVAFVAPPAGALTAAQPVLKMLSTTQVADGLRFMRGLAVHSDLSPELRQDVASVLRAAEGERFHVSAAPSLSSLDIPHWAAQRTVATINGYTIQADTDAAVSRTAVRVSGTDGVKLALDAAIRRAADGEWVAVFRTNGGPVQTARLAQAGVDCTITCFVANSLVALAAAVFCYFAAPSGPGALVAAVVCAGIGFVVSNAAVAVCERIVESCDADPNRRLFAVNIAEFECTNYWSCETRGAVSSHQYNGELTQFFAYLEFYYNGTDFAYQEYRGGDLGLRQTAALASQQVWQFAGTMQPSVPTPYCAKWARFRVWAGFGTAGGAYSERGFLKPFSDSCVV